ncbi:conserved hypothetical protein [Xanthomonas citri pv. aurantifolii str. ICPB 10535]|nr:conserved hypothetical protein [Xanthomonas citri pv. aurantifolii str. ICPB 10535]
MTSPCGLIALRCWPRSQLRDVSWSGRAGALLQCQIQAKHNHGHHDQTDGDTPAAQLQQGVPPHAGFRCAACMMRLTATGLAVLHPGYSRSITSPLTLMIRRYISVERFRIFREMRRCKGDFRLIGDHVRGRRWSGALLS